LSSDSGHDDDGAVGSKQGKLVSYRYLNHRMLDLVQNQVELMRSRMVRRIEWRVEQASALRRCFPEGECLCSTSFEAAGIEGLQLVFYPSGYVGARDGYCSFFLHCPAGSFLRCWLSIGKQRREGRLSFERPGFYGRTNFCRFEFCIDTSEDIVLLVLEIDEAQQNVTETMSHALAPTAAAASVETQARSTSPGLPGLCPGGVAVECGSPLPERVDSSMKFRRNPGRSALEDVRQLPSIWTSRPQANLAEALEGFHTFNDLKARKAPGSGRRAPSSAGCRGDTATPLSSAAPAHPAQKYIMYAS